MPVPIRPRSPSPTPPTSKKPKLSHPSSPAVPLYGILPLGNAPAHAAALRFSSLGRLAPLPDELILHILALLPAPALLTLGAVSKSLFAFSAYEAIWKHLYVSHPRSGGTLEGWRGSWRKSYIVRWGHVPEHLLRHQEQGPHGPSWPSDHVSCSGVFSDVLYQPHLCASLPLAHYFSAKRHTLPRRSVRSLTRAEFARAYAAPNEPVILTGALDAWPAFADPDPGRRWTLDGLARRFPEATFRAEALGCSLGEYARYARDCAGEDAPVYLFDSAFVESTRGEMGGEFAPMHVFGEDLFSLFGPERPDYRWLIIGPARSGSTFHKDPNSTSAWNALLSGRKGWIMFPPAVLPPGVYTSADEAEVTSPVSVAEWFEVCFAEAWGVYGPNGKGRGKGRMRVGVQERGEVVYVPSGWWHLVVNLEPSIAVTQNFVSRHELPNVLTFMRDKPGQISGFKPPAGGAGEACDPDQDDDADEADPYRAGLYARFCDLLRASEPELLQEALGRMAGPADRQERGRNARDAGEVGSASASALAIERGAGFSFDFELDGKGA